MNARTTGTTTATFLVVHTALQMAPTSELLSWLTSLPSDPHRAALDCDPIPGTSTVVLYAPYVTVAFHSVALLELADWNSSTTVAARRHVAPVSTSPRSTAITAGCMAPPASSTICCSAVYMACAVHRSVTRAARFL